MTEIIRGCRVGSLPCLGTAGRGEWAWLALADPVCGSDRKAGQKGGWSDLPLPDRPYLQEGDLVLDEGVHGQVGLDLLC